jgi:hypothetical protein
MAVQTQTVISITQDIVVPMVTATGVNADCGQPNGTASLSTTGGSVTLPTTGIMMARKTRIMI